MEKQEQLIRTAFKLFYTRGIHAVGINLVLAESGIAKKTLYNHFPSKEHLVEAVVRYRNRKYLAWLASRLNNVSQGKPALLELFNALDDWFHNRALDIGNFQGCFFVNVSAEFGDGDSVIRQACAEHKAGITKLVRNHVDLLALPESKKLEVARAVELLKEGAISLAYVQGKLDAAVEAKEIVESMLHEH